MAFRELTRSGRSGAYAFMVGEIRLRPDGKGEGKLAAAARVRLDEASGQLGIENYDVEPVRLGQVIVVEGRPASR